MSLLVFLIIFCRNVYKDVRGVSDDMLGGKLPVIFVIAKPLKKVSKECIMT